MLEQHLNYLSQQLNNFVYCTTENYDETYVRVREGIAKEYGEEVSRSFLRQYVTPKEVESPYLRVSSLGKPAVLQALTLLGYESMGNVSTKLRNIFHTGDVFEAYVVAYMKLMNWKVSRQQEELEFDGVLGHIDGVINVPDFGECLLEFKTMSQFYFSSFVKQPNDDRGYITQLAIYSHCLNIPAAWIVTNKGTHEVAVIQPDQDMLDSALARAHRIIPLLNSVKSLHDVVSLFKAPPPQDEVYRSKKTGSYVVPGSMKYSKWRFAFYNIENGKTKGGAWKEYITSIPSKDEQLERLEKLTAVRETEVENIVNEEAVLAS